MQNSIRDSREHNSPGDSNNNRLRWYRYFLFATSFFLILFYACKTDDGPVVQDVDTDGDGILDEQEITNGTNKNNPCDPLQNSGYKGYDATNTIWLNADCDQDGQSNGDEVANQSNPYFDESSLFDSDGDGILDDQEELDGTDKNNPCDPAQDTGYDGFDASNPLWSGADCDQDGVNNGDEIEGETDPYFDESTLLDTDGDGITDDQEELDGTDKNDPCDPLQNPGYEGYDADNTSWQDADCDGDGVSNGEEVNASTDPYLDENVYVVPEFLPNLSDLKIFEGNLSDLVLNTTAHEYSLSTPLFTDYAYKLRTISLPKGGKIQYNGEGLLLFPDNTVISKTFYYLQDERNPSLGKKIIETRVMIKKNGIWEVGNYYWNTGQTEAQLDQSSHFVQVSWIDMSGANRDLEYRVPNRNNCFQCHNNYGSTQLIGPKARALNFVHNGKNQLQDLIDKGILEGAPDISQIVVLPDWSDTGVTQEERARAYLDVNCAHCHQPGGTYNISNGDTFEFRYETSFQDSNIFGKRTQIRDRMNTQISNYFMPFIGTSVIHEEGVELINAYIDSMN